MNDDIKRAIRANLLRQYQVAERLNVSEFTLIRWLRGELTPEKRERIFRAIEELKEIESTERVCGS